MSKILGLDLGTSSIGLSVRDTDQGKNLKDQIVYFTSDIFKSGVGKSKNGEYSYAAKRTEKRSPRRLFRSRKNRIWATLDLLIEYKMCPLSIDDLDDWRRYDKKNNQKRCYPVNAIEFERWVRLDFNGDGVADYTSPYQLRAELMNRQFDMEKQEDRYKLGRALYHIAQRRGFRSSKGETISDQKKDNIDDLDVTMAMKKSEENAAAPLTKVMEDFNLPTAGCALAALEKKNVRLRDSEYKVVRSQYKEEIVKIFEYQNSLSVDSQLFVRLISEKKGEGTIFYKKPLKSQKGLVGKCTLEPNKPRCPISHPEYEKFRAWCFINNIQFRISSVADWQHLTLEQKSQLFKEVFLRVKNNFDFKDIRNWIENKVLNDGVHEPVSLKYAEDKSTRTVNYSDSTNVSGCPVSARLKNLLGEKWQTFEFVSNEIREDKKKKSSHQKTYSMLDIWHVCFSFDEPEYVEQFAIQTLRFDEKQTKKLTALWGSIQQGYGKLSLKAIRNINRFLEKGLGYSDAALIAKLPDIFVEKWDAVEPHIIEHLNEILEQNKTERFCKSIVNSLIANYRSIEGEKQAVHDTTYQLQEYDLDDVEKAIVDRYGKLSWTELEEKKRVALRENVIDLYQKFFASSRRGYYKLPKLSQTLSEFLEEEYPEIPIEKWTKIYHPSMIEMYPIAKEQKIDGIWMKQLGSPVIGAIKNPMAMRVLHVLRRHVNSLLRERLVDEDTRVVVETARDLCDANRRSAVRTYQNERERENKEIFRLLQEYIGNNKIGKTVSDLDVDRARLILEQHELVDLVASENYQDLPTYRRLGNGEKKKIEGYKKDVTKYKLWLEQGGLCIYTCKKINISSLFSDGAVDIEHTIPRSISFDNSLSNLTLCDAQYNRSVKRNQMPSQLPNYKEILERIEPWRQKVDDLKEIVTFWKAQAQKATTKDRKNYCIKQYHLYGMDLEYWQKKVETFCVKEVKDGFRNSQLVDTRIISKYAFHYLKTVFNNVDVQKGAVTAIFRKILGLQNADEKKNREKHSHHAIDATMLTLIPVAAKRDEMLQLFFKKEEGRRLGMSVEQIESQLKQSVKECRVGDVSSVVGFIESNILINHISKDQTLAPTNRRVRVKGKIVPLVDENGNVEMERDENGELITDKNGRYIPKAKRWIKGDCIRGQLHGETFYGAIQLPMKDANGSVICKDDGSPKMKIFYVVRRKLEYKAKDEDAGFKNWDDLERCLVDKDLLHIMKRQFPQGTSFKDACNAGIYMLNAKGEKVNKIRHVRCFTTVKNPLQVKKQTYPSDKAYKQYYYSEVGELYAVCKYQSEDFSETNFVPYSLFDISENKKVGGEYMPSVITGKRNVHLHLKQVIKKGDVLLLYKDAPNEVMEMDTPSLSDRLYVVKGLESDGPRISLVKHINSQPEKDLGKGEAIKDYAALPQKIRCVIGAIKFLQSGVDFDLTAKGIEFKSHLYNHG